MRIRTHALALVAVLALGLGAVACGEDDPPPTFEFGEGEVPETFPADFPIPTNARIGSTLIDRVNNRSEVSMTMATDLNVTVQFFTVGLVNQGYVVDRSSGDSNTWVIELSRGELEGTIVVTQQAGGTQAVARINTS